MAKPRNRRRPENWRWPQPAGTPGPASRQSVPFPISLGGMYTVDEQAEYQEQPGDDGGAAAAAVVETQMKDAGKQGGQPLTFAAPAAKEAPAAQAAPAPAEQAAPAGEGGDHNPGF